MIASDASVNRRVGRPSVNIKPEQVGHLKAQGLSWRRIGKTLGIGTATAMRLFKAIEGASPNIQDVRPKKILLDAAKQAVLKNVKVGDRITATVYEGDMTLHKLQVVPKSSGDSKSKT
jgi:hypothetical protein